MLDFFPLPPSSLLTAAAASLCSLQERVPEAAGPVGEGEGGRALLGGDSG